VGCLDRVINAEYFRRILWKLLKTVLNMFLFFSRKKRAEEEKQAQHTWGPCTLASRQYEILHLVVIQSWTHLVLYGKSSGGVEIFTRRIMKFCGVFSSCKIRCIPRQRCETRSSWYSGVKADIVHHQREGGIDKVLFRIFSVYFFVYSRVAFI